MSDPVIHHALSCPGAKTYTVPGRYGDTLVRCRGCQRYAVAVARVPDPMPGPPVDTVTPERTDPVPVVVVVPVAPMVGMVCRDHHRPVTWKGTGCRECEAERAERVAAREAKRREARRRRESANVR